MAEQAKEERRPAAAYVAITLFALTVAAMFTSMLTAGL